MEFPHPYNEVPALFLDVPGEEVRTPSFSWTNVKQIKATQSIYNSLRQKIAGKLVILCYYSSTVHDLKNLDDSNIVSGAYEFLNTDFQYLLNLGTKFRTPFFFILKPTYLMTFTLL